MADLIPDYRNRPPVNFDQRTFYRINLIRGRNRIECTNQRLDVNRNNLWFSSHRVPYRCIPHDQAQAEYFCIFTDGFLQPNNGVLVLHELLVFQPGSCPVVPLADDEYAIIKVIFREITQ